MGEMTDDLLAEEEHLASLAAEAADAHWLDLDDPATVDVVARALRTFDETDVACRLEPGEHADEWAPALIDAIRREVAP